MECTPNFSITSVRLIKTSRPSPNDTNQTMNTDSSTFVRTALLVLFLSSCASVSSAQALTGKELRRVDKAAQKAFAAGELPKSLELYERIVSAAPANDPRRGNALYVIAFAGLAKDMTPATLSATEGYLSELSARFPRHPRRLEIATTRDLLLKLAEVHAEAAQRTAELNARVAAFAVEQEQAAASQQASAGESEAAEGRVKDLETQLRRLRATLAETQSDLAKKEESLQKLRDALVGRAGG